MHVRVRNQARGLVGIVVLALGMGLVTATSSGSAVAAKAVVVPSPCGTAVVKKADGTPWTCTWGDDFTGSKLDTTKWFIQTTANSGYNAGNACYTDTAQNVTQSGGTLKLVARKVLKPFVCTSPTGNYTTNHTSGTVSTFARFSQTYGRVEIRAKFPTSRLVGLQSALWMYPVAPGSQPWPYSGEIDIAEWYSQYYNRVIPYLHYGTSYLDANSTNVNCMVSNVGAFHTYDLEWTPTSMKFIYDGKTCMTNTAIAGQYPFNKAYMLVLSQLLGVGDNAPTTRTVLPATTTVDYVHVWS
ncbi:MAG TPA: glycoside hydrolase family 16 protein [Marmoricola sp.]|jgi:beta-glucanase (GH16 family)|nr:glycoside hydrolase family 16 protein [Marmoricola sp.]